MGNEKSLNADEAREIAFKKQDEDYLENLENLKDILNKEISIHSKLGNTYFTIYKVYDYINNSYKKNKYCFPYSKEEFYIDKKVLKELKNELEPRGFKIKKGVFKIKVSWWK